MKNIDWKKIFFFFFFSFPVLFLAYDSQTLLIYTSQDSLSKLQGYEIIEAYPEVVFAKLSPEEMEKLKKEKISYEIINLNELIMGNGIKIDTSYQSQLQNPLPNLFIVQFSGPIKKEWIDTVESYKGIERVYSAYFQPFGLLYWIENKEAMEFLKNLNFVKWIGDYLSDYKTSIDFSEKGDESFKSKIKLIRNARIEKIIDYLNQRKIEILNISKPVHYLETPSIVLNIKAIEILSLLNIPEIFWVEEMHRMELRLATARELHQIGVGNGCSGTLSEVPIWAAGITGAGSSPSCTSTLGSEQLVGIIDTTYNSPDLDCASGVPNCTIFKYVVYNTTSSPPCSINNTVNSCQSGHGHGTGSSGVILGNGLQSGGESPIQLCSNKGMAFGARLWAMRCDSSSGDLNCLNDCWGGDHTITLREFFQASFAQGSRMSNHSWGASVYGTYDAGSEVVDIWSYDNDNNPSNGLTQEYLWFFAAGNDGPTTGSIGSPATAKNDVTGAAFYNGVDGSCWSCDSSPCNENKLVCYSSRGPTDDGRYGPEVAGTSQYVTSPANGSGYQEFNGTSCGTPSLTAQGALIRDWIVNVHGISNPSASLIKALLLNSGDYINLPSENLPGTGQGWGKPNLSTICDNWSSSYCNNRRSLWLEGSFTSTGQSQVMDVFVITNTSPLKCLLTWLDPPNLAGNGALINNLNLRVTAPNGTIYRGNNFTGAWSNSGAGAFDALNNSEGVRVQTPMPGLWQVEVLSGNIAQSPQPWTVTCSGDITNQTSYGIIKLDKSLYSCSMVVNIMVSDADLRGNGTQSITISSNTETIPETVILIENPSGSGIFKGSIQLTSDPAVNGDGKLSVSHNNTITATYIDLSDGQGNNNVPKTETATTDCQPPVITNVQVSVNGVNATITWNTDENSNSVLYYGNTPPNWSTASDPAMVTSHSITIKNLDTCTKYYFWVQSTDIVGNTGSNNNNGSYYTFVTGLVVNLINENFEGPWGPYGNNPPSGWIIEDHGSVPGTWNENDWYKYSKGGVYGYVARVYYSPLENQDEWLITPAFNISSELTSVSLEFDHYFYEYSAEDAYVDIISNQNPTWTTLAHYNATTANMAHENISLNSYIGNTNVKIRFRYVGYNGWYWEVDNVKIVGSGICATSAGQISMDRNIYHCNNDTIWITIRDTDLSGTAQATVTTTGGDQETVTCYETGVGVFKGSINTAGLPRTTGDGILQLIDSETITAIYYDANDGTGNPQVVQDTAITDCKGPVITNVQAINITGTTATITWTTDENSNSRVTYGTSIPPTINQDDLTNYVKNHSINLSNLSICTPYYYSVTSADLYGNSTTSNNNGNYFTFTTINNPITVFSENFNSITPPNLPSGWTVSKTSGNDWVTNSSGCTGNALMYPYHSTQAANSWAYTPGIYLTSGVTYTISFNQKVYSSSYPEKMELKCGTSATPAGQTITIMPEQTWTNTTCTLRTYQFTVPATGIYYIGFHCTSAADMWNLYIDDINITRPGSCLPELVYKSRVVTDACNGTGSGGGNGILEPGEDATIQITLENLGGAATGVSATLSTSTPGIIILKNNATFPNISAGGTGTSNPPHFAISVDPSVTCVTEANFTLHTISNENPAGNYSFFTIYIGQAASTQTVFAENFTSITPPNLPSGWTRSKTSGNDWQSTNSYYCNGAGGMYYPYHITQAANSWAYTPGITLQSGVTYTLNFNQKVQSASYPETFEVKCGTSPTPAGQTITILPSNTYTNTTCTLRNPTFTVPTSGTYYIGFHCTSAADMYYLIIDDINLTRPIPPVCNVCTPSINIIYSTRGPITEITGDGDSFYEKGEKFSVQITLTNNGIVGATNVIATLAGNGIEVCNPTKSFGNIPVSGTGSATFEFVINKDFSPCGGEIGFDIINKSCNERNPAGANELDVFKINVGQPSGGNTVTLFGPDDLTDLSNWTLSNYRAATTSTCHSAPDAQSNLNGTSYMTLTNPISTLGYTNITVYYDWHVTNTNATQYLDWSTDRSNWNLGVASVNTTDWLCNQSTVLPQGAEGQATLYIRFRTVSNNASRRGEVDYIRITGRVPETYNCNYIGNGFCPGIPKPIPDGTTGFPLKITKMDSNGSILSLDWDTQCTSRANILYGNIANLSSYSLSGAVCSITDNYLWNIGNTTNIWFVLVSDNGAGTESSWGLTSSGQRNGTTASGQCGNNLRDNSGTCP